ncbi:hypothetical protein KA047_00565 [Candidatus Saccharibacteria bacterium]|nr:hypothetical protein [Candidatus Saccharibacteria bacterium]
MSIRIVEYPPDTRVIRDVKGYFSDVITEDDSSFIRSVTLTTPRICTKSLEWLLKRADDELQTVAELCEAEVVPHEWGILKNERRLRSPWQLGSTLLVAKVDRITPIEPIPEAAHAKIIEGTNEYFSFGLARLMHRYRLADIHDRQFVYGINENAQVATGELAEPGFHLADIEPRFRVA